MHIQMMTGHSFIRALIPEMRKNKQCGNFFTVLKSETVFFFVSRFLFGNISDTGHKTKRNKSLPRQLFQCAGTIKKNILGISRGCQNM